MQPTPGANSLPDAAAASTSGIMLHGTNSKPMRTLSSSEDAKPFAFVALFTVSPSQKLASPGPAKSTEAKPVISVLGATRNTAPSDLIQSRTAEMATGFT